MQYFDQHAIFVIIILPHPDIKIYHFHPHFHFCVSTWFELYQNHFHHHPDNDGLWFITAANIGFHSCTLLHMWLVVSTRMTKCVVCVLCNFVFFKKISPIFISMSLPVFCVFLCFCVFVFYCCVHVVGSTVSVFFVFLCFFLLSSVRFFSSKSVR